MYHSMAERGSERVTENTSIKSSGMRADDKETICVSFIPLPHFSLLLLDSLPITVRSVNIDYSKHRGRQPPTGVATTFRELTASFSQGIKHA